MPYRPLIGSIALFTLRMMATELRVDSSRPESEQIKIVVMALRDDDKDDLVEWAIEVCSWSLFSVN